MTTDYEDIFATLDLDERTLQLGHDETITPTIVSSTSRSGPMESLPRFTMEHRAVSNEADYTIMDTLGEGGMGIVSLAEQHALKRLVAVKQPKGHGIESHGRVLDEAFIMGRVEHPNVVPAYGLGRQDDGRPMLVMKRVEGTSWEDIITGKTAAPNDEDADLSWHLNVLLQVCNALRFAHARKVVHRDIKPENVMVGDFGEVYLLDWGIALSLDPDAGDGIPTAATTVGMAGTPAFMAPEMTIDDAEAIDERTDVYLLGATLHLLLTGHAPHSGNSLMAVCMSAYKSEPRDYAEGIPEELGNIARTAMAREKSERFQSVTEFSGALHDYLEHRASYQLSDAAWDTLTMREPGPDRSDERSLQLLEAEFGFRQALTIWAGNSRAQDGLQRAVEIRVETCLDRRELGGAQAAIRQLPRPNPDLDERVTQLAEQLEERAEHVNYLETFERELDLKTGTGSRQRTVIFLGLAFTILCLVSAWGERPGEPGFELEDWMSGYWRLLLIATAATVFYRRKLFANVANRRMVVYLAAALLALFIIRYSAVELRPSQLFLLVVEQAVMGMTAAAIGIATNRVLAFLSLSYGASALATLFMGELWSGYLAFAVAHVLFFGYMTWIWRRPANKAA